MSVDVEFDRRYEARAEEARRYSSTLEGPSLLERWARLPVTLRQSFAPSTLDLARLNYDWSAWARPKQDPRLGGVEHRVLLFLAGRGFGKSLTGAQRVRRRVAMGARSIAIIGPTLGEVEQYMIGGEGGADGLLSVFPRQQRPVYKPHKRKVVFHSGAVAYVHTAEEPEFRGTNLDTVWADEPGKWRYLDSLWSNIELSTRLPGIIDLELIITGTPVPRRQFREWVAEDDTVTIVGAQRENAANLDRKALAFYERKFAGTRQGRQELDGEILTDNPDALFKSSVIDRTRVQDAPPGLRIAVAIDPAQAVGDDNDDTGIVVVGIDDDAGELYVLDDRSMRAAPDKWAEAALDAYDQWHAEALVVERNRGGDMAVAPLRLVRERQRGKAAANALNIRETYATRGKHVRAAESVQPLHEQLRLHHVGVFPELETELTEWNPRARGPSPNRLDALVWGVWYLARLGEEAPADYKAGFKGLAAAAKTMRAKQTPAPPGGLPRGLPRLPRAQWGSKL